MFRWCLKMKQSMQELARCRVYVEDVQTCEEGKPEFELADVELELAPTRSAESPN